MGSWRQKKKGISRTRTAKKSGPNRKYLPNRGDVVGEMKDFLANWFGTLCPDPPEQRVRCWLDVSSLIRDVLVSFTWLLILIYTCAAVRKSTSRGQRTNSTLLSRYSLHDLRWLLALALFLAHLVDLGEVSLVWKNDPTQTSQLALILPVCNAAVVALSCIYFDRLEVLNSTSGALYCQFPASSLPGSTGRIDPSPALSRGLNW